VKRFWTIAATILALFLTTYLLAEAFDVSLLTDPRGSLREPGWASALLGVFLLVADQFVPVPSSLVMIALGASCGAAAGIALSLAGRVGMAAAGFAIGRAGGPLLERMISRDEAARADALLARWGALAILVSRPVPLLAETVAIVAGTSRLPWSRALGAAALGSLPEAVVYSLAGAVAPSLQNAGLIWGSFLVIACGFWFLGRWIDRRAPAPRAERRPAGDRTFRPATRVQRWTAGLVRTARDPISVVRRENG
jgi:uncharacterized membrane protein YdjX (TVP38/TMEM64 family)